MQGILFSTAICGSHIYQPAQAPLAIVCSDEESTDLSKTSTATTSIAAAIATASNLAVAAVETLPLMDVDNDSHVLSTSPIAPPLPFLLPASGSAGKCTHLVMTLGFQDLQSASTGIATPSTNADLVLKKQAKNLDLSQKSHSSQCKSQVYGHAPALGKIT